MYIDGMIAYNEMGYFRKCSMKLFMCASRFNGIMKNWILKYEILTEFEPILKAFTSKNVKVCIFTPNLNVMHKLLQRCSYK